MLQDAAFFNYKAEFVSYLIKRAAQEDYQRIAVAKFNEEQKVGDSKEYKIPDIIRPALEKKDQDVDPKKLKFCIIGAGVAGLYTALMLEKLGIDYEILEASDRIGGRIFTHHFTEGKHDYYDIGAMRFPDNPIMKRTFDLFKRMGLGETGENYKPNQLLMPYYLKGRNCPTRYNDITALLHNDEVRRGSIGKPSALEKPIVEDDPFKVSTANGGPVPMTRVSFKATAEILDDAYDRFRNKIKRAVEDLIKARESKDKKKIKDAEEATERAWDYLMRHDKFSMRDYLMNVEGYDAETVHWLETTDSASGWFNEAFAENVLESLAFGYDDKVDWYCIEGGTGKLIDNLTKHIQEDKIKKKHWVTRIALCKEDQKDNDFPMEVEFDIKTKEDKAGKQVNIYKSDKQHYSAVINTTTLGALQKMDLTGMALPYGMKTAIRVLHYDTSTKVGIKFKKMWWKDQEFMENPINLGGVAKTDMSLRVCVYPSYNIDDPIDKGGVLLASYTWGQDSERIASHISSNSPEDEEDLLRLMLYNLARLHTLTVPEDTYDERCKKKLQYITELYEDHHAYDWSKDPHAAGAFALFSPGQFSTLIPYLMRPAADSRFVIIGEAASANHAWIVGALDSAVRGLRQILTGLGLDEKNKELEKEFGKCIELKAEQLDKQVGLGRFDQYALDKLGVGVPVGVELA